MSSGIKKAENYADHAGSRLFANPKVQLLRRKDVTSPIIKAISKTNEFEHDLKVERAISNIAALVLGVAGIALLVAGYLPGTPSSFTTLGGVSLLLGLVIGAMNFNSRNAFKKNLEKMGQAANQDAFSVITFANGKHQKQETRQNVREAAHAGKRKGQKAKKTEQQSVKEQRSSFVPASSSEHAESEASTVESESEIYSES